MRCRNTGKKNTIIRLNSRSWPRRTSIISKRKRSTSRSSAFQSPMSALARPSSNGLIMSSPNWTSQRSIILIGKRCRCWIHGIRPTKYSHLMVYIRKSKWNCGDQTPSRSSLCRLTGPSVLWNKASMTLPKIMSLSAIRPERMNFPGSIPTQLCRPCKLRKATARSTHLSRPKIQCRLRSYRNSLRR